MQQPATHRFGPAASCPIPSELFFAVGSPHVVEAERPPGSGRPGRPNGAEAFATFAAGAKDSLGSETKARLVGVVAVRRDDLAEDRLLAVVARSPRAGVERARLSVEVATRRDGKLLDDAMLGAGPRFCAGQPPSCRGDVSQASLAELSTAPLGGEARRYLPGVGM